MLQRRGPQRLEDIREELEDTQGAKGAGFLGKYRNKPNKRVVKVSQEEKKKNRLRLVASQVKAGNDNP